MDAGSHVQSRSPILARQGWLAGPGEALSTSAHGSLSDETLVLRSRAGDHTAFDVLVARYRTRLYAMALDSLGSVSLAGDALCETVLSAFQDIDSISAKCTPRAWLYVHGLRAVFKRLNVRPGQYRVESAPTAQRASAEGA